MNKGKQLQELTGDFDSLLYYDKKALEKRMGEWLTKKDMVSSLLDDGIDKETVFKATRLSEKEFSEMLEEIEKENN